MDPENGCSPYKLQHDLSLVGFTDPGVDFMATVAGCFHVGAHIGEFFNDFLVFFINHDWFVHCSVLPQNEGFLCVDFETNSVGCISKSLSFLLGMLVSAG